MLQLGQQVNTRSNRLPSLDTYAAVNRQLYFGKTGQSQIGAALSLADSFTVA